MKTVPMLLIRLLPTTVTLGFLWLDQTRTCTGDGNSTTGAFDRLPPTCERKCIILF